jgi:hypothetical protein
MRRRTVLSPLPLTVIGVIAGVVTNPQLNDSPPVTLVYPRPEVDTNRERDAV